MTNSNPNRDLMHPVCFNCNGDKQVTDAIGTYTCGVCHGSGTNPYPIAMREKAVERRWLVIEKTLTVLGVLLFIAGIFVFGYAFGCHNR